MGGYEDAFRGYGYDEEEISLKLWLFGHPLMTSPPRHHPPQVPPLRPLPNRQPDRMHNRMYAVHCHQSDERTQRLSDAVQGPPACEKIRQEVFTTEHLKAKREAYRAARQYDDWYFRKFSLPL